MFLTPNPPSGPQLKVLLPPAEAKRLDQYRDGPALSAGFVASALARRGLKPRLLDALRAMKKQHLDCVERLAANTPKEPTPKP